MGVSIGYTRTSANWSTEEAARINDNLRDGLRRFYREREWTFLKPWRSLATEADVATYQLPPEIGYIEGNLFWDQNHPYPEVTKIDPEDVERRRGAVAGSSIPRFYAIRPLSSDGLISQRNEIIFSPTPSDVWTLTYKGRILPDAMTTDRQFALGGAAHSQTILEACLAAMELGEDDTVSIHEAAYSRLLAQSIDFDVRAFMPRTLGYNGNRRRFMGQNTGPRADLAIEFDQ